jgi:hypothetical protein
MPDKHRFFYGPTEAIANEAWNFGDFEEIK